MINELDLHIDKSIIYTPIVYNENIDYANITNVLLVDSEVGDYNKFVENCNVSTFPIVFTQGSNKEDVKSLLSKLQNISRIGIVANNSEMKYNKKFVGYKSYFEKLDLIENQTNYSENLQFLIDIITTHNVKNIDFLACYSLTYDNWKKYYDLLTKKTGVIIGASDDKTGNIKYGGDWIMESSGTDVESIYFTNGINNYHRTLDPTTISGDSGTLTLGLFTPDNTNIEPYLVEWPVTLEGEMTIRFFEDFIFTNTNNYFKILNNDDNVTIDGNNYKVTINVNNYDGLVSSVSSNTIVEHVGVENGSGSLAGNCGWIGRLNFNGNINYCYSIGDIINTGAGGIAGRYAGKDGICNITNCNSNCNITGPAAGGIVGSSAGEDGICNVLDCYSIGIINNDIAGGIVGSSAGQDGICNITNCYSLGEIKAIGCGGISGGLSGYSGICNITNCYSSGEISGSNAGGISGSVTAYTNGSCKITNCYSSGEISGGGSGGIVGNDCGEENGICDITNCYSSGEISAISAGGIAGVNAGYKGLCNITNCYSIGGISGIDTGGITGSITGYLGVCNITNCYTTGAIGTSTSICGGIVGRNSYDTCLVRNCYVTGSINPGSTLSGIFQPTGSNAVINTDINKNSPGWDNTVALQALDNTSGCWKTFLNSTGALVNIRWNLVTFLTRVEATRDLESSPNILTYTNNIFPINSYLGTPTAFSVTDGTTIVTSGILDETGKIVTFTNNNLSNLTGIVTLKMTVNTVIYNVDTFKLTKVISITSTRTLYRDDIYNYMYISPISLEGINRVITIDSNIIVGDLNFVISPVDEIDVDNQSISVTVGDIENYHTITINNVPDYQGLVFSRSNRTRVENLGLLSNGNTSLSSIIPDGELGIPLSAGWIGSAGFLGTINNCNTNGDIGNSFNGNNNIFNVGYGGIAGAFAGFFGMCKITNCYSTGDINSFYCGGIVGMFAAGALFGPQGSTMAISNSNKLINNLIKGTKANKGFNTIKNHKYFDIISAKEKILKKTSTNRIINETNLGNCIITNCYSTGKIGPLCGGITGIYTALLGTCKINNCYSIGDISGYVSGGIVGFSAGVLGRCNITNCYSTGDIYSENISQDITPTDFAGSGGIISSSDLEGIVGIEDIEDIEGSCIIKNCYSTGNINSNNSGGITGPYAGIDVIYNITNCYSTGDINGDYCGGIVGKDSKDTCVVRNCYVTGILNTEFENSGIFQPVDSEADINPTVNKYSEGWFDNIAKTVLIKISSVWKKIYKDIPWKLKSFLAYAKTNYINGTLTYTSIFPISSYQDGTVVRLLNKNKLYGDQQLDQQLMLKRTILPTGINITPTQTTVVFTGVGGINNGQSTYLILYDNDGNIIDYIYVFVIIPNSNICLVKGTPITLDSGVVPIEEIKPGKHKINGQEILAVSKSIHTSNYLVCFEPHSICINMPSKRTIMTHTHSIYYTGRMRSADSFLGFSPLIRKVPYNGEPLYNVLLKTHSTMKVNNMTLETLNPNAQIAKLLI